MTGTADDWGEGYVVEMDYVDSFHPALAPLNLAFSALAAGGRAPDLDAPFAYLDLGCGSGFSAVLFAAANPHAEIWGSDFNPAHIRTARATAGAAAVPNAHFLEASFAALADASLPRFDIVVLHGVWSWVSPANRAEIVARLDALVKPGGLVMISYNCHPGWDPLLPLRRMVGGGGGDRPLAERITDGLATARALCDAGADYFRNNPGAATLLDELERADPRYVAHEFGNTCWTLFHAGEVAAEVAAAGLRYVGQARAFDDMDRFLLTPEQIAFLDRRDAATRESLRDLLLDRRFRSDLYVRCDAANGADARAAWIDGHRFALTRPRADCSLAIDVRAGPVTLPAIADALLDRLAEGPATGAALAEIDPEARSALLALIALGYIQPALAAPGDAARRASTEGFNAAALERARVGEPVAALASPVTGSGLRVEPGDQMLLDAYRFGVPLAAMASEPDADGTDPVARFRDTRLPLLELLGIA